MDGVIHGTEPLNDKFGSGDSSVFSGNRTIRAPSIELHPDLKANTRQRMDGMRLLSLLPENLIPVVFFDPQYRGILEKMKYGNEGKTRGWERASLRQMSEDEITAFIREINRILIPSGHLFLWIDKFHLCQGIPGWTAGTELLTVDMITWNKMQFGMGYRTRRTGEHLLVLQRKPKRAKGVWKVHDIRDVWEEKAKRGGDHTHRKPVELQTRLISAVSNQGDIVVDPAAGSFSVMEAAAKAGRNFLGCDIVG